MPQVKNEIGHRFGQLVVLRRAVEVETGTGAFWECQCDCGGFHITSGGSLRNGSVKSCGCLSPGRRPGPSPKCKYCDKPAATNRNSRTGANKGYYPTCGSEECSTAFRRDPVVVAKMRCRQERACELCGEKYITNSGRQRRCKKCVPNKSWNWYVKKYRLPKPVYDALLLEQGGHCALCDGPPTNVDHDHETGVVRGLLCNACNFMMSGVDRANNWLERAVKYAERGKVADPQQKSTSLSLGDQSSAGAEIRERDPKGEAAARQSTQQEE